MVIKNKNSKNFFKNVIKCRKNIKNNILKKENLNIKIKQKTQKLNIDKNINYKYIYDKIHEYNTNGKKTIVYFNDSFYPNVDGVVMVMDNYVKYMSQFYNVVVCAPRHKKNNGIFEKYFVLYSDSIYLKKQGYDLAFPKLDKNFQKFISLLKIDLIHIHSPFNLGSYGLTLAKMRNIPCFTTFHSQFKRDFYNATKSKFIANMLTNIILKIYKKSTLTLTMNEFSKNLLKEYGLNKKIEIISNATNMIKQEFEENFENNILNKYGINKDNINLLFIGRMVKVKNVYFILDILKELKLLNNEFNFIFMGDGPERNNMESLCINYNIEKNVNFIGKILDENEKAIIIKNSKLLLFPSEYDTDGIVKMECACYDVPSMCIKNTGAASNIVDNFNGYLVNKNKQECAEKINNLIKNVENLKIIGKNANLTIYKTWNDVCGELNKIYIKYLNKFFKNK